ncbi:MAG: hypothetical protein DI543_13750 [Bradyrhizobium icense]|nr:MAG: hypothetical protein DI543_13750 [Bradyrhizobium icense]
MGVVSLVSDVAPVLAAPDGDVVDGDVVDGVPSLVVGVVPPPVDGDVDVDVLPNFVLGATPPGPVVPGAPPLLASLPF